MTERIGNVLQCEPGADLQVAYATAGKLGPNGMVVQWFEVDEHLEHAGWWLALPEYRGDVLGQDDSDIMLIRLFPAGNPGNNPLAGSDALLAGAMFAERAQAEQKSK
jgi:hypothetical protein